MPYAIYHLKVPKKILTNVGIVSGNPDNDGLVVDSRFTTRAKCPAKVVDDVQRFVKEHLFIHSHHAQDENIDSIEELNFEVMMSSQLLFNLLRRVKLEAVSIIHPKHNEVIDRALNVLDNKSALLSAARARSHDYAERAKVCLGSLADLATLLFDESMSHRQDVTVAQMDVVLHDLYIWL